MVDVELDNLELFGIDFPKDFKGGDSIRDGWIQNMTHFCNNFKPLNGKFDTEQPVLMKVDDDHYLQGYIDLVRHNEDSTISIIDWKTSSLYKDAALEHALHQLIIYAMAKEAEGYKVRDVAWFFMKYVEITYMGYKRANSKNKTEITKVCERKKIAETLSGQIRKDLEEQGYSDFDCDLIQIEFEKSADLNVLPEKIRDNYKIKDYIMVLPYTIEAKEKTMAYIKEQIENFEKRSNEESDWEHKSFTKITNRGKEVEDTFYCNSLCSFGDVCKHIKEYNDTRDFNTTDDDDLFDLFG